MTERLYHHDSYVREFSASVIESDAAGCRVCLDRTAFYPTSGGQPHDTGTIAGVPVVDVLEEGGRIVHVTSAPVQAGAAECRVDWPRRFDYMQQHSGQHLLSAVLAGMYGAPTAGIHLGGESSAIDVSADLTEDQIAAAALRANEIVFENRRVSVSVESEAAGLRKPSGREGPLRIVTIEDLDRSACGGTHVRATGEIGPILIRRLDRAHGNLRIEFLCGLRAVARARADFAALSDIAKTFSAAVDDTPELVASQARLLGSTVKAAARAEGELARIRGRELYQAAAPDQSGLRCVVDSGAPEAPELARSTAQGFTAGSMSCYIAAFAGERPAVLLAVSKDAGIHAGNVLKEALAKLGGRGGGSAQMAQGSVPAGHSPDDLAAALRRALRP
jgi:alanyl-tRNA synthetase